MSETPHMIVKSESYKYELGPNSLLGVMAAFAFPWIGSFPLILCNSLPETTLLTIVGSSALGLVAGPWVTKMASGADARRYNNVLQSLPLHRASPTLRNKRELVSKDETTGEEVYLTRNFKHAIIETHTPENPGKTWDRVYESLLKVHDLKETDFLVYAEAPEESDSTHGKLLPWKHSINKAMAFTGYELSCDCRSCVL
jgi:hypothetical protein